MPAYNFGSFMLALIVFTAIKMAGYTIVAIPFAGVFHRPQLKSLKYALLFGAIRTIIGITSMVLFRLLLDTIHLYGDRAFYIWLIPVRFLEWLVLLWLFYDRRVDRPFQLIACAIVGVILSYLLDLPATIGKLFG